MVLPGVDPAANMKAAEQLAEALDTGETNASVVGGDAIMVTICPSGPGENAGDNGYGPRWNAELPESVTQWTSLVRKHFCTDWGVSDALTIIACESVGDENAYNPSTGVSGLFQIHPGWFDTPPLAGKNPYDPDANVEFAAWLWRTTGGWSHWHCRP